MRNIQLNRILQLGAYAICYLLLLEWLRPLRALTNIDNMMVFIIFTGALLVLSFFRVKIAWKISFVTLYILFSVYYLYFQEVALLDINWFLLLGQDITKSIELVWALKVLEIPYTVQTILLFFLLSLVTFFIYYFVMRKQRIFFFLFLTILFIGLLDTFSPYDGNWAIIRVMVMGFVLLGLLSFKRKMEKNNLQAEMKQAMGWFISLVTIVIACSVIAFLSPKFAPQWADPVPFLKTFSNKFHGGSGVVKTVGFGEDDSRLGGDFKRDATVVFTAATDSKQYWKIETKDVYTGSGWVKNGFDAGTIPFGNGATIPATDLFMDKGNTPMMAMVEMRIRDTYIPYPNPVIQAQIKTKDSEASFVYTENATRITSVDGEGKPTKLDKYQFTYEVPVFNIDQLRTANNLEDMDLFYTYTVLPTNLPERIRDLAISLTQDKTNQYDKVKAIESYFQTNQFLYANADIPYPEVAQDFVDQFLFETKRGYCVHFSTAMAVMLRSIDIPTRWVKGYTPGEVMGMKDGKTTYQITNNNAHAWVEVYFQGVGWVPFEPTKGFANAARFETNPDTTQTTTTPTETPTQVEPNEQDRPTSNQQNRQQEEDLFEQQSTAKKQVNSYVPWPIILLVLAVIMVSFLLRRKWIPFLWLIYFRRVPTDATLEKAYEVLLKQLKRCGFNRQKEVTLREFAKEVDLMYGTREMSELTDYYEQYIYGEKDSINSWKQAKPLWQKIMKKTMR
ncbi:MAG: transglutaminaseTgpA domain-containing protein [Bacillaceae bacterium]